LRGQIRMEETVELDFEPAPETTPSEAAQAQSIASTPIIIPEPEKTQKIPRKKKTTEPSVPPSTTTPLS